MKQRVLSFTMLNLNPDGGRYAPPPNYVHELKEAQYDLVSHHYSAATPQNCWRSIASKEVSMRVKQREMSDVCHGMPLYSSVTLPGERCMSKDVCSTASKYSVRRRVQQQPKMWEASIGETTSKMIFTTKLQSQPRKTAELYSDIIVLLLWNYEQNLVKACQTLQFPLWTVYNSQSTRISMWR